MNWHQYLIDHYTTRLAEERQKGNVKAIAYLRQTLHQLKNKP